jgi:riboflavin kinase/FMN adenylyltransferase
MTKKIIIKGRVIRGDGYGKQIGFPTLNIDRKDFIKNKINLNFGVYSGLATLNKKIYRAGIVIGPLDKKKLPKIEAHLLGYSGDVYGRQVVLEIGKFIRKYKKFKTESELIKQIGKDLKKC